MLQMKNTDFYLSDATWLVGDHESEHRWSALIAQSLNHCNTLHRPLTENHVQFNI